MEVGKYGVCLLAVSLILSGLIASSQSQSYRVVSRTQPQAYYSAPTARNSVVYTGGVHQKSPMYLKQPSNPTNVIYRPVRQQPVTYVKSQPIVVRRQIVPQAAPASAAPPPAEPIVIEKPVYIPVPSPAPAPEQAPAPPPPRIEYFPAPPVHEHEHNDEPEEIIMYMNPPEVQYIYVPVESPQQPTAAPAIQTIDIPLPAPVYYVPEGFTPPKGNAAPPGGGIDLGRLDPNILAALAASRQ